MISFSFIFPLSNLFKVHVSPESTIPDHCRTFALSDAENSGQQNKFQQPCNHEHKESCDRCLNLSQVSNL